MTSSSAGSGKSYPIGARVVPGGIDFSLYWRHATGLEPVLFDRADNPRPARAIPIWISGSRRR